MTNDEKLIAAGHQCEVGEPGYYWARMVVWQAPAHLPQKREWPMLCNPCPVQLSYVSDGSPMLRAIGSNGRARLADWLFIERIPDIPGVEHVAPPASRRTIKPWPHKKD